MNERKERCKDCKYYYALSDWHGRCQRHAPVIIHNTATWPGVMSDRWCGDFKEKQWQISEH